MLVADMTLELMRSIAKHNGCVIDLKCVIPHRLKDATTIVTANESYKVYQLAQCRNGHPIDRPDEFMVYVCGSNPVCILKNGDTTRVMKAILDYEVGGGQK